VKKVLRNPTVQAILGWVLATYIALIRRTVRWRHEDLDKVLPYVESDIGVINLVWHSRIPIWGFLAELWARKPRKQCLVSPSADGEFLALALVRMGYPSIRMSSAKKGDATKARQAVAGFREAIKAVDEGAVLLVTPDGPRGPNEVMALGALQIAKRTGAPVFLTGIAASPHILLNTWDKVMLAAPFGRGVVTWDGPYYIPADADEAAIAQLGQDWSRALSAVARKAEALSAQAPGKIN